MAALLRNQIYFETLLSDIAATQVVIEERTLLPH
jgi:hypothetical protein